MLFSLLIDLQFYADHPSSAMSPRQSEQCADGCNECQVCLGGACEVRSSIFLILQPAPADLDLSPPRDVHIYALREFMLPFVPYIDSLSLVYRRVRTYSPSRAQAPAASRRAPARRRVNATSAGKNARSRAIPRQTTCSVVVLRPPRTLPHPTVAVGALSCAA